MSLQKKLTFLIPLTIFSFCVSAQNEKSSTKDQTTDKYAYVDVIKTYEKLASKGYKSVDLFQKLGNAYYANCDLNRAAIWYGELFAMTYDLDQIYYYRYAESLRFLCQDEKADALIEKLKPKSKIIYLKRKI